MKRYFILLAVSLLFGGTEVRGYEGTKVRRCGGAEVTLLFTGDLLLDRGVRRVIERRGADALFSHSIDSLFATCHAVIANLECPVTHIKAPVQKRYIFRGDPEMLPVLKRHGITHLNLCNNHSIDQGREGLTDTRRNIQQAGMTPFGAGRNMQEAAQPLLLTEQPRRVWLLTSLRLALENYAYLPDQPCVSQEPMDSLLKRVATLRRKDPRAVIIVSLHWGGEHTLQPVPRQRLDAHRLIRAGADALICHHTHTLQTVEHYQGRPIYYSIGNFIFDLQKPVNTRAAVVKITVGSNTVKAQTIPIDIRRCVPYIATHSNERSWMSK